MMSKTKNIMLTLVIVLGGFLVYAPIVYFSHQESMQCDEVIFLKGELSMDVRGVSYISNGNITRIHFCDGRVVDVPTSRVIKVVSKEND